MEAKNYRHGIIHVRDYLTGMMNFKHLLFVLFIFLGSCDYSENLYYGYFYRDEGGDAKDISNGAQYPRIPATIIDFDYSRDFIIAKQKPKLPQEILYDMNYLYKDGVDTFYWIISTKNYFGLGPLDKQEYEAARKKYGVPDKLKLE